MVLARVDLAELIGQYVALTPAGREHKGRCPFHEEKTASFHVNVDKGLFHCFGCKAGGNAIDFVMRIENLEFRDALEWLANRYNIEIPQYSGGGTQRSEKERLFNINEAALVFFRQSLKAPGGDVAMKYLKRRGVDSALAAEFDLGYAPREWQALADFLMSRGAKAADLLKLGLAKERRDQGPQGGGEGRKHYDAFRHRLTFAIRSVTGRVIGFAGRALSDEDTPKYLNVTNTPLYNKSQVLYNLDRAKGHMRDAGAVVVEGYMDVIGLASAGVHNTVATCGTALTPEHVKLLKRYGERFYLAFDGDDAGRRAAWSAGVLFLREGLDVRVVDLPAGQDPDDFARREGLKGWQGLLDTAKGVARFWLDHQMESQTEPDMALQRRWVAQLAPLYRQLPDELVRQQFQQEVSSALRLGAGEVSGLLGGRLTATSAADPKARLREELKQKSLLQGAEPVEREVLRRLAVSEEFRHFYFVLAGAEWFAKPEHSAAYAALVDSGNPDTVVQDGQFAQLFASILADTPLIDDNEKLLVRHRNFFFERKIGELNVEWQKARQAGDTALQDELMRQILKLKAQIKPVRSIGNPTR